MPFSTLVRRKKLSYTTRSSFLQRIKDGSEEAWHDFYRRYAGMIRNIGRKRRLTDEECDELLNEVMVIFWKKLEAFTYDRQRGKFRSYLGRIADYAALKLVRRGRKAAESMYAMPTEYPDDIDLQSMAEWRDFLLENALADLKASVDTEVYQAFYMSVIQHRSVPEVAAITRKTPNNIYVIRSRCLKKLKAIIAAYREHGDSELALHSHRNSRAY